jgi:hypothetical protein
MDDLALAGQRALGDRHIISGMYHGIEAAFWHSSASPRGRRSAWFAGWLAEERASVAAMYHFDLYVHIVYTCPFD